MFLSSPITVGDPKVSHCFQQKRWKSGTLWEHLPKRYYFWTIIKQKKKKSGTIWASKSLGCETLGPLTVIYVKNEFRTLP